MLPSLAEIRFKHLQQLIMEVLVIEDELKLAQSIKSGLEELGIRCDYALEAQSGLDLAESRPYSVIVSDVILPGLSGVQMVRELRNRGNQTPVIILSALGQLDDKETGFDAGADDYLVKPFEFKELIMRLKALSKRPVEHLHQSIRIYKYFDLELNYKSKTVTRSQTGIKVQLTPKEFALLDYFVRNPERIISKEELWNKVWDLDFDSGTNIIEVYINFLRKKIDKDHSIKLIHTVYKTGYIFRVE